MRKFIAPVLLGAGLFFAGCTSVDAVRATSAGVRALQAATISDSYVQQYVRQYVQQLDSQNEIASGDSPYAVRINRLTAPFNGKDGINIKVYMTNEANAFATADGSVRVYSGLMDIMSDEELLGVIGHEIGHYKNHDTRDAFRNALLTSALREGIASTGGVAAALSSSQLGDVAEALSSSQYSQKQESDADIYGYNFLKDNGINPWAMSMAFDRLYEMEQAGGRQSGAMQQLFSTHPDLKKRARKMADMAMRDGYPRPGSGTLSVNTDGRQSGYAPTGVPSNAVTSDKWTF